MFQILLHTSTISETPLDVARVGKREMIAALLEVPVN
ncbi:hypothetical protein FHT97_006020 [Rhizobium sp. BK399]|nr:hypothetical protein [Rhizobium sp. BK399]